MSESKWERRKKRQRWLMRRVDQLRKEIRGLSRAARMARAKIEYSRL